MRGGEIKGTTMKIDKSLAIVVAVVAAVALVLGCAGLAYGMTQASNSRAAVTRVQAQMHTMQTSEVAVASKAAGTASKLSHLGVCWYVTYGTASGDYGTYAEDVGIDAVTSAGGGIYTCPSGDTYSQLAP
jgi:Flp pilus assembly protein CpaB